MTNSIVFIDEYVYQPENSIKWNNILSERSNISNGVKQGGCISPTLFSIYLNGLIQDLRLSSKKIIQLCHVFLVCFVLLFFFS